MERTLNRVELRGNVGADPKVTKSGEDKYSSEIVAYKMSLPDPD